MLYLSWGLVLIEIVLISVLHGIFLLVLLDFADVRIVVEGIWVIARDIIVFRWSRRNYLVDLLLFIEAILYPLLISVGLAYEVLENTIGVHLVSVHEVTYLFIYVVPLLHLLVFYGRLVRVKIWWRKRGFKRLLSYFFQDKSI